MFAANASTHTHFRPHLTLRAASPFADALAEAAAAAQLDGFFGCLVELDRQRATHWAGADDALSPASMMKTPLAVAVAAAERTGRLAWSDRLRVDAANLTFNDAPSPLELGASASIAELVNLMISRSDNVATNLLIDAVGRERANADLAALGFGRTRIRRKLSGSLPLIADPEATGRNSHPAREAAELFARLDGDELPGSALIRSALAAQYWNTKLSAGLAAADRFAHKTGDTDEVSHDGGLLELATGRRFVLVVYTGLPSSAETDAAFAAFMRALRPRLLEAKR